MTPGLWFAPSEYLVVRHRCSREMVDRGGGGGDGRGMVGQGAGQGLEDGGWHTMGGGGGGQMMTSGWYVMG